MSSSILNGLNQYVIKITFHFYLIDNLYQLSRALYDFSVQGFVLLTFFFLTSIAFISSDKGFKEPIQNQSRENVLSSGRISFKFT